MKKKNINFPIYPCDKPSSVFENIKSDIQREKQKEIYDMMEIPVKNGQFNPDTQLTINRFMNYENFILENEAKLKASIVSSLTYVNTKRKRCLFFIFPNILFILYKK